MTPNRVYQATVEALESVLPPRVVSLVLREGLGQAGRTPTDLRIEDVEPILTGPAFRRLQSTMSAEQARQRVKDFVATITVSASAPEPPVDAALEAATAASAHDGGGAEGDGAQQRLESLRAALRPFNMYFDWHEVRKLRTQLQLAEEELAARVDASASLDEAAAQLEVVRQKLEDRLVLQARELAELEEAFGVVESLGGPRVRRLDALIGQIRHAQASREVAEAEIERAAGIARDLRKLMESSVAQPIAIEGDDEPALASGEAPASDDDLPVVTIDETQLPAEVSERLRRVDLEGEAKALAALTDTHAELLRYLPHLSASLERARAQVDAGIPLGTELDALRSSLAEATRTQRAHLAEELATLDAQLPALQADDHDGALERALRVAQGVLDDTLPAHADVAQLRELHESVLARADERRRRDEERRERLAQRRDAQRALLARLQRALDRAARGEGLEEPRRHLEEALTALERADAEERIDDDALSAGHRAEQAWEHALAAHASDGRERQRARVRELLAQLESLPGHAALAARTASLQRDLDEAAGDASLGERHVETLASMVEHLRRDALDATARQLERLAQEAGEAAGGEVLQAFQAATRAIQAGGFPDVSALTQLVSEARERHRDREQRRWQRLQQAKLRYDAAAVPSLLELSTRLDTVKATLQQGRSATSEIAHAEAALAQVEREVSERLERFGPRLDAAMATLARVERLNNDDVAAVRRVLYHLDSQRDALPRVSPGLQHQLERALGEAEQRLPALEEAFEATRAVADRLVESNVLDDMLGFFDDLEADAPDDDVSRTWVDADALHALVAAFRRLDDVDAAAVVSGDGRLRSGDLGDVALEPLVPALRIASSNWGALGGHLGEGSPDLVDLTIGDRRALLTSIGIDTHAVLVVRSSGAVSALATRLREQRTALVEAVAAAS